MLRKRLERAGFSSSVVIVGGLEAGYKQSMPGWVLHAHLVIYGARLAALSRFCTSFQGRGLKRPVVMQPLRHLGPQLSYVLKFTTYHRPVGLHRAVPLNRRECCEWVAWAGGHKFADYLFLFGARRQGAQIKVWCRSRS
jgi:hypothetical protein